MHLATQNWDWNWQSLDRPVLLEDSKRKKGEKNQCKIIINNNILFNKEITVMNYLQFIQMLGSLVLPSWRNVTRAYETQQLLLWNEGPDPRQTRLVTEKAISDWKLRYQ
jgi:hypothetical protein